ncbi:MAG: endonuclease [Candidatus Sericytochromatia bacterium]
MKKFLSAILITSVLVGCSTNSTSNFSQIDSTEIASKLKDSSDWYSKLSPELQSYYAEAKGKTGSDLFDALHKIISAKTDVTSYQDAKSFMYATADNQTINGKTGIFDAYSYVFVNGSGGNGDLYKEVADDNKDGVAHDFINCEHTWPQSFFNKQLPMVGDLHHLQSTLSIPNNRRSHFPFGEVKGDVVYSTSGGSKLTLGKGNKESFMKALNTITQKESNARLTNSLSTTNLKEELSKFAAANSMSATFEPGDQQKGNTARAMLYFFTRYYDKNVKGGEYSREEFWNSKVSTFINWSEVKDRPDEQEIKRNSLIQKKQGNRNPFIDVPEFASLIGESVFKSK